MKPSWQKTSVLFLSMTLLFCYGKGQQNIPGQVPIDTSQEISLFRQQIIAAVKDKNTALLKQLNDSSKIIRYEKHILLTIEEKRMLALLSEDFLFLVNEKWDFNEVFYTKQDKKNRTVYVPRIRPGKDWLNKALKEAVSGQYVESTKTVTARDTIAAEEKDFLIAKITMLYAYSSYNKKEPLKLLDKKLLQYRKKYPQPRFKIQLKNIEQYAMIFKRGAFFGLGASVAKFNNGVQHLFTTPVNYQASFDLYTKRIGWYLNYNITMAGFKNKVDTMFNDKLWRANTKNFASDFQAGFGYVALKANYIRIIVKVGVGSFVMRPQKKDAEARKIKLGRFPVFGLGGCVDIANFRLKFIEKENKVPLGIRFFYNYNFLGFKNKYPQFPTNIQNYGIQFGLML